MKGMRFLLVTVAVLLTSACSTKAIKTYEGEQLSQDQQAVLTAGDSIQVTYVDGVKQKEYMLSQLDTHYALKPGKHRVVFYFTSVWARSKVGPEGERSELVESGPQVVEFDVGAGQAVSFDFAMVDNIRDAKVLASSFVASVVDKQGKVLGVSTTYDAVAEAKQAASKTNPAHVDSTVSSKQFAAEVDNALPALDGLKVLWERASAEDKKIFLKWAFK